MSFGKAATKSMKTFINKEKFGIVIASFLLLAVACSAPKGAPDIIQRTIDSIDSIQSAHYKQITIRTNPQNPLETITRFREIYFERLMEDSIVGVKGHWFMYVDDTVNVVFEDIYDGTRIVRKNNRDSIARIYDFEKYPRFREQHFWGHNTPYSLQYELKYMLENEEEYNLTQLSDTVVSGSPCYQIHWRLEGKSSMPGFMTKLENHDGWISETTMIVDKATMYPCRIKSMGYMMDKPEQVMIFDQTYYSIDFNKAIDASPCFSTSLESLSGYEIREMQPE